MPDYFLFHEFIHLVIGLLIGLWLWKIYRQKRLIIISLAISLGIDIDHLLDYFHYFGLRLVNPITGPDYFCLSGKLLIPFHSWEFIILIGFLMLVFKKWRMYLAVLLLDIAGHLLIDQLSYHMYPLSYSLIFRLLNNFNINIISWGCQSVI